MEEHGVPILISIQSSAALEGEDAETISLLTAGELFPVAGGYLLRYEETMDESVQPTQVELLLEDHVATMRRSGEYDVNMVFRKGQRYEGQYHTPYGTFDLALYCTKISYAVDPEDGELHLQYQLNINGEFVAMHELELYFTVKEGKA
jgi:uncharacterized beta-barrel protein YwiB (DUF1934 family)